MIIAVILAGGVGTRMGADIPKQFVTIYDKPIIAYTLESFERHEMIDGIAVVCVDGWHDTLRGYAQEYNITKLRWLVSGGGTVQESIRNGVTALGSVCQDDDILVIHDSIRPIIDDSVLTDVITVAKEHGNAVTSMPYNEQIFLVDPAQPTTTTAYIPRETLRRVSTPQAYRYRLIAEKYEEAFTKQIGIYGSAYTNTMMVELGVRLFFAKGSDKNLKLTTPDDLAIFKGYISSHHDTAKD